MAWKIPADQFAALVKSKTSVKAIAEALGIVPKGGSYLAVKNRIIAAGLDISHFKAKPSKPLAEVMVENSTYSRSNLKRQIIEKKLIPYICALCGQGPIWHGKPLVLRLDHKNGVNDDHRFENLRFVCPNCDSQLPTFSGRNVRWCNR